MLFVKFNILPRYSTKSIKIDPYYGLNMFTYVFEYIRFFNICWLLNFLNYDYFDL